MKIKILLIKIPFLLSLLPLLSCTQEAADPDSPHFDDQAQRCIDREFKHVAYYREDVERRAQRIYHPGSSAF